jgi:hypothetical protein
MGKIHMRRTTIKSLILIAIMAIAVGLPGAMVSAQTIVPAQTENVLDQDLTCPDEEFTAMVFADWLVAAAFADALETSTDPEEMAKAAEVFEALSNKYAEMDGVGDFECFALQMAALAYFSNASDYTALVMLGTQLGIQQSATYQAAVSSQMEIFQQSAAAMTQFLLPNGLASEDSETTGQAGPVDE